MIIKFPIQNILILSISEKNYVEFMQKFNLFEINRFNLFEINLILGDSKQCLNVK